MLKQRLKTCPFSSAGARLGGLDTLCDEDPSAPHRCADKSSFLTQLSNSVSLRGSTASSQRHLSGSRETAEQIGEQTVTLGHSHYPLSEKPRTSGGGLAAPNKEQ